jgi:hypothetical protein
MNKNILFKDALKYAMVKLETAQSHEMVLPFMVKELTEQFSCSNVESERLVNLMVQHGYMNRKDQFFTTFIKPTQKTYEYFNIDRFKFEKWFV